MNPLRTLCLLACFVAAVFASGGSSSHNLKPSQWLDPAKLQSLPSVEQISYQRLENMPAQQAAEMINAIHHLSQINHELTPTFVPSASSIPTYILTPSGQNVSCNLGQLVATVKKQPNFGEDEVTIIITGIPQSSPSAKKATQKLVEAYMQRYNAELLEKLRKQDDKDGKGIERNQVRTSSEEDDKWEQLEKDQKSPKVGEVIVIDLGQTLQPFKRAFMLDTEKTGAMIGDILVDLAAQNNVPEEVFHLIGQGAGAHVAGAAGRRYRRQTGRQLRRITGLDPARKYTSHPNALSGLARGDADFVDVIHTSAYGMGEPKRYGDVDFYPNGPCVSMPGTDNIIESSMRATRYFAESVRPGHEHNFPAVRAYSLEQYMKNKGNGKRAYMGYAIKKDVEGDYILEVNEHSPFGKNAPATRQEISWKKSGNGNGKKFDEDYE